MRVDDISADFILISHDMKTIWQMPFLLQAEQGYHHRAFELTSWMEKQGVFGTSYEYWRTKMFPSVK